MAGILAKRISRSHKFVLLCAILLSLTLLAFGRVTNHQFIRGDDDVYVLENPNVNQGLSVKSILWAFSSSHGGNWHPLTSLSHMLDCELFGLEPKGPHLENVLLHAAGVLLLFVVLKSLTADIWPSLFAAALFAVHPLRVESVVWVSERKDVLSGVFFMLTILAYLRYCRKPSAARYAFVFLLLALGLMAKPMLVTVPFLLLLLDYWPLRRMAPLTVRKAAKTDSERLSLRALIFEKMPLFLLVAVFCVITFIVQRQTGMMGFGKLLPASERIENAAVSYVTYITQSLFPHDLAPLYPYKSPLPDRVIASALFIVAVTAAVIWRIRRRPYLFVGWLWFLVMLVPVIGFVQVGVHSTANRYTYLPSIGLTLMVCWFLTDLVRNNRKAAAAAATAGVIVVCTLAALARTQAAYWKDSATLYKHTLNITEKNFVIHDFYGRVLMEQGDVKEAISHFEAAVQIEPRFGQARCDLGLAYRQVGRHIEAVPILAKTLSYGSLAEIIDDTAKLEEVVTYLRRQVDANSRKYVIAMADLAWFLASTPDSDFRDPTAALNYAKLACAFTNNRDPRSLDTLAVAYAANGDFTQAIECDKQAIKILTEAGLYDAIGPIEKRMALYRANKAFVRD